MTKIKAVVKLYGNGNSVMAMVCEFEERAEELSHSSLVKEGAKYAEEVGLQLQLESINPTCIKHDSGEVITAEELKAELRRYFEQKTWEAVHEQNWQGKLISARSEDVSLNFEGCFWWLSGSKQCPTHTAAGVFELYEQLSPTRLYACQKTHTDMTGEVLCALCNGAPESVAYVLAGCTALAKNKYVARHNAALKILFFVVLQDLGLVNSVPPWYSPLKPKPVYEANNAPAFWDVPLFAEHQEVRANRVDARIINHESKQVITLKKRCLWFQTGRKKRRRKLRNTDRSVGN